jgi:ribosomal protein S18 acetylase RimI-like enzyme
MIHGFSRYPINLTLAGQNNTLSYQAVKMNIINTNKKDAGTLATLVSESNKDVADLFNLHINNAPKHPSFCTLEWILADFARGQEYLIYTDEGIAKGCVAYEQTDKNSAYLNRLSVLPKYRRKGIGEKLVHYILEHSNDKQVIIVSIGIIAEHTQLKEWYLKLGFSTGSIKKFEHLPFNVLYMQYNLCTR